MPVIGDERATTCGLATSSTQASGLRPPQPWARMGTDTRTSPDRPVTADKRGRGSGQRVCRPEPLLSLVPPTGFEPALPP